MSLKFVNSKSIISWVIKKRVFESWKRLKGLDVLQDHLSHRLMKNFCIIEPQSAHSNSPYPSLHMKVDLRQDQRTEC